MAAWEIKLAAVKDLAAVECTPVSQEFDACLFHIPSEEFELTVNSLGAQIETHGGLILRTLGYLTVNSLDELTL